MTVHLVFDLIAAASSMLLTWIVYRWRLDHSTRTIEQAGIGYAIALVLGAAIGGYGFGTLNLWLGGIPAVARSIVGALAGAILAIEVFKWQRGLKSSTGLIFVPAFSASVAVGRIGCFQSGLEDETHGIPTALPWGYDFGDGILRHPVQLYESVAMAVFLALAITAFGRRNQFFLRKGFYLMTGYYAGQRFIWEFLKPYQKLIGPFNLFHLLCAALVAYAVAMTAQQAGGLAKTGKS